MYLIRLVRPDGTWTMQAEEETPKAAARAVKDLLESEEADLLEEEGYRIEITSRGVLYAQTLPGLRPLCLPVDRSNLAQLSVNQGSGAKVRLRDA